MDLPATVDFFALNTQFNDYCSLLQHKKEYENYSNTVLVVGSSIKLKGENEFSKRFVYDRIIFRCKAGMERPCRSNGIRQSSTYKKNCGVKVTIVLKGQLIVTEVNLVHENHFIDRMTYDHYPENMRLTESEAKAAEKMISVGGNKKIIKMDLMAGRAGKPVSLKSLHNIQAKVKARPANSLENVLQELYAKLSATPGMRVRFVTDQRNELLGIFMQDERMAYFYEKYPELILFDATYKLNNQQMPLFTQLCVDGNGETEVVSLYVCRSESREGIGAMLGIFKELNSKWEETKVIIGDKDFADRSIYTEEFPNATLQICMYHVLVIFCREITTQKRGITATQRMEVLEILMRLVYSRSNESYDLIYRELCSLQLEEVLRYYDECWHSIKEEWTLFGRNQHANYMNYTNNRSERLNRTVKQIGNRYANLWTFFQNVTTSMAVLASEKDIQAVKSTMKVSRVRFENETLAKYNTFLTSFIYKKTEYELHSSEAVEFVVHANNTFETTHGHLVTEHSCSCMFFSSMTMPCRHIFKLLKILNVDEFVPSLFAVRWTKAYYYKSHPALSAYDTINTHQAVCVRQIRVPDEIEKYKKVATVTKEINNLVSAMSGAQYEVVIEQIKELRNNIMHPTNSIDENPVASSSRPLIELPNENNRSDVALPTKIVSIGRPEGSGNNIDGNSVASSSRPVIQLPNENKRSDVALLANVTLPTKIVSIGRPKGSGNTIIGTKRKKTGTSVTQQRPAKKQKFSDLSVSEKGFAIIRWFTNMSPSDFQRKKKIRSDDIIQDSNIFNRLRNDEVELQCIKKVVDAKCYKYLVSEKERIKESQFWACSGCKKNLTGINVMCASCLDWFHFKCTGIKSGTQSEDINFFCSNCNSN